MKGVLTERLPGQGAFHLLNAVEAAGIRNRCYIPGSTESGLTRDTLMVEQVPATHLSVADVINNTLARETAMAGKDRLRAEEVASDQAADALTIHTWFTDDPVLGDRHVIHRAYRDGDVIQSLSLVRKLDALPDDVLAEHIATVENMDARAIWDSDGQISDAAAEAIAVTERLRETRQIGVAPEAPEKLLADLKRASPLHDAPFWAFDVYAAIDALESTTPDRVPEILDDFPTMLGLAVLAIDDVMAMGDAGPATAAFERIVADCLDKLARYLIFAGRGESQKAARRAEGVWTRAAAEAEKLGRGERSGYETLAAFASALSQLDKDMMLDIDLAPTLDAIKAGEGDLTAALEALDVIGNNAAYVGRRIENGRGLLRASCVASDIAGFIVECEGSDGVGPIEGGDLRGSVTGHYVATAQSQLDAQSTLFGIDRPSWDMMMEQGHSAHGALQAGVDPGTLFYMRPLRSSRRMLVDNGFRTNPHFPLYQPMAAELLPDRISLEAALHWGLCTWFRTQALGGPVDIFGMGRDTVMGPWQLVAAKRIELSSVLVVVASDSAGLSWEFEQIRQLNRRNKVMAVLPPLPGLDLEVSFERNRAQLASFGLHLPERMPAGFALFDAEGTTEMQLPFDSLWDDSLRETLARRVYFTGD